MWAYSHIIPTRLNPWNPFEPLGQKLRPACISGPYMFGATSAPAGVNPPIYPNLELYSALPRDDGLSPNLSLRR